jgi:hypothetical protein
LASEVVGPVAVSWDAEARLLRIQFVGDGESDADEMRALQAIVRSWVGEAPYGVLATCHPDAPVSLRWRRFWIRTLGQDRKRMRLACYALRPEDRASLWLARRLLGLRARSFPNEAAALRWIEEGERSAHAGRAR